jgi:hypothetical protein
LARLQEIEEVAQWLRITRLICLSADLIDGGAGVRFTVPARRE